MVKNFETPSLSINHPEKIKADIEDIVYIGKMEKYFTTLKFLISIRCI